MAITAVHKLKPVYRARREHNLIDSLFYVILLLSLYLLLDPFYGGYGAFRVARDLGPIKYIGISVAIAVAFLGLIGLQLRSKNDMKPWGKNLVLAWPFLTLAVVIIFGSLYARWALNISETFLQLGVGIIALPAAIIIFWAAKDGLKLVHRLFQALLLVVPYVLIWTVLKKLQGGQAFHMEVFLLTPLAIYFSLWLNRGWAAIVILICLVLGLIGHKYTGYFVSIITVTYLILLGIRKPLLKMSSTGRIFSYFCITVVFFVSLLATAFLFLNREAYLPSGSSDVRLQTYNYILELWLQSPFWGDGFTSATLVDLYGVQVFGNAHVITHSDILDILGHGGLFAIILFILGWVRIARLVLAALATECAEVKYLLHGLVAIIISGLLTASFNSALLSLPISFFFWFLTGFLFAVAYSTRVKK